MYPNILKFSIQTQHKLSYAKPVLLYYIVWKSNIVDLIFYKLISIKYISFSNCYFENFHL